MANHDRLCEVAHLTLHSIATSLMSVKWPNMVYVVLYGPFCCVTECDVLHACLHMQLTELTLE